MKKPIATVLVVAVADVAMAAPVPGNEFRLDCRTGCARGAGDGAMRAAWIRR